MKLCHEVAIKSNQVRFIREFDASELRATDSSDDLLAQAGFQRLNQQLYEDDSEEVPEADFSYLLGMSFDNLRPEKADALEASLNSKLKALDTLIQTSEDSMWLEDLRQFRNAYIKEYDLDKKLPAASTVSSRDWTQAQKVFKRQRKRKASEAIKKEKAKLEKRSKTRRSIKRTKA